MSVGLGVGVGTIAIVLADPFSKDEIPLYGLAFAIRLFLSKLAIFDHDQR